MCRTRLPDSGPLVSANNAAKRVASLRPVAQASRPPRHQSLHLQRDQRRRVPQPWRSAHQTHPPGAGALHLRVSTLPQVTTLSSIIFITTKTFLLVNDITKPAS